MSTPVLEVNNLKTYFFLGENVIPAVDSVGFSVNYGETLGIVGESGSGKSVTALSIMRLIPNPPGKIVGGQILFEGEDLLQKTEEEMRKIRGNKISMIFQEPMTSLNPVYTVGSQIAEAIILHQGLSKKDALKKSEQLLEMCKVSLPKKRLNQYPHELSGGMRQRVMIAMALACDPLLLIADEPTTALDVTVQAQILELMKDLQRKTGTAVLFITHDLGVINEIADKVVVMYCGRVVECGKKEDILKSPEHPYTKGLLNSIPVIDGPKKPLRPIRGVVPSPNEISHGCRFKSRCDYVMDKCEEEPPLMNIGDRLVRCWLVHNFEK
ncbi:MAG: ABC transporter ATP-binding protein [Thermovirga sp.]|nr:ABC transporter ATP-binding protein [Thermovirga sp.]